MTDVTMVTNPSAAGLTSGYLRRDVDSHVQTRNLRIKPLNAAHPSDARSWASNAAPTPLSHSRTRPSRSTAQKQHAMITGDDEAAVMLARPTYRRQGPRNPQLLPRDAKIKANDLLDVALFLRDTAPAQTPTRPTFEPKRVGVVHKRPFRRALSFDRRATAPFSTNRNKSLTHFKPQGVVERISKDGKKYLQIIPQDQVENSSNNMSTPSTTDGSTASPAISPPQVQPTEAIITQSNDKNELPNDTSVRNYNGASNTEEIHMYISALEDVNGTGSMGKMPAITEIDLGSLETKVTENQTTTTDHSNVASTAGDAKIRSSMSAPALKSIGKTETRSSSDSNDTLRKTGRSGRLSAVTDARAALYSHPTSAGPAPSKPLPSLPADGVDYRNRMRSLGQQMANSTSDLQSQHATADRSSNQGVRRSSRESPHPTVQDFAQPSFRIPTSKRSLNALQDFLSNEAMESVQNPAEQQHAKFLARPSTADSTRATESIDGRSIASTATSRPPSSQAHQRRERTRARKLRDLDKSKTSIDAVVDMPLDKNTSSTNVITEEELRTGDSVTRARQTTSGQRLQISGIMLVAEENPSTTGKFNPSLQPSLLPLLKTGGQREQQTAPTLEGILPTNSHNLVSEMDPEKKIHPALRHQYHSSIDSNQSQPYAPETTLSTPRSVTNTSTNGAPFANNISPGTRAELRIRTLERKNRLLEAALDAMIQTNGQLNGCPCSAQPSQTGRPSTERRSRHSTRSSASTSDFGGALELYKATRGTGRVLQASIDSSGLRETSAEERSS